MGERRIREKKNMEQKELAAKVGIKSNAVSNWENGRTRPDIALLPKICQVLGVSMDDLFDIPKPETETPSTEKPTITMTKRTNPEEEGMLEEFQQLSEGHRSVVISMVSQLRDVEDKELYDSISEETKYLKGLSAGCDAGTEYEDPGETIHLYKSKLHPLMDCVFTVSGDSMEPAFHDGDIVLVKHCVSVRPGEVGIFTNGDAGYIKVYQQDGLHSINPCYATMQFCESDDVRCIGKVIGIAGEELFAKEYEIP